MPGPSSPFRPPSPFSQISAVLSVPLGHFALSSSLLSLRPRRSPGSPLSLFFHLSLFLSVSRNSHHGTLLAIVATVLRSRRAPRRSTKWRTKSHEDCREHTIEPERADIYATVRVSSLNSSRWCCSRAAAPERCLYNPLFPLSNIPTAFLNVSFFFLFPIQFIVHFSFYFFPFSELV